MIEIFARSPGMQEASRLAERVSSTDANVLITGESGAGKDLLAAYIHTKSRRAPHPFVKIDCATLPGELLEAELFGYERGAFTGAVEAKAGRFEAADKGTVVLDEIAHLSTDAQAKLLRVIERREFERLGGRKTIKLDARVIALTNVDLDAAVKNGRFREDLYYRLNVINIRVPPLRARKDDLSQLIQHFLKHYSAKHGRDVQRVSPAARTVLKAYDYPGNARELANIIERAVIVATGKKVEEEDLPAGLSAAVSAQQRKSKPQSLAQLEASYISETLAATGGNKAEAARILGISRKNLYEKIARYQLSTDYTDGAD
ncbi:MAG TPA: sigma-54 dependent transcriptional regulator [Pyrinomonadaceae bacterium]|nr:sigma-54 dependent transcriptional regulator [Pyrinomonadaceae bacterium]